MTTRFTEHIKTNFPYLTSSKVLVAVSGGVDSMVLACLCKETKIDFAIAHCNFKLRGAESDADEVFVKKFAERHNIPIYTKSFNTAEKVATSNQSVQMVARDLRYQWFNQLCTAFNFDWILTAHHLDDSIETFFINLSRGTGLEGLTGVPEVNINIIRPLLPFTRNELIAYARKHAISWREDSSNLETKYLRNKIRHQLVPILKELNTDFTDRFRDTQQYLSGSSGILKSHIKTLKEKIFKQEGAILKVSVEQLLKLTPLDAYLFELFKDYKVTSYEDLKQLLVAQSGKQLLTSTHHILKDRGHLQIMNVTKTQPEVTVFEWCQNEPQLNDPIPLKYEITDTPGEPDAQKIYVDKEKLKFPLIIRKWKNGDYFYPAGMRGRKKLSKFFKDEKYSLFEKEAQWLLCSEHQIIWVVGKRADRRFLAGPQSKDILEISCNP
jgi:tRNA(Ile)-lysidine synthase